MGTGEVTDMTQIEGDSFDEALRDLRAFIDETGREAAAFALSNYPDRDTLNVVASMTRRAMQTSTILINAVYNHQQITVGGSPHVDEPRFAPESESLCTFTVGTGKPLAVNDLAHSDVSKDLLETRNYKAWASAPIMVDGKAAGSLCALEANQTRIWTDRDQAMLERGAAQVSEALAVWMYAH